MRGHTVVAVEPLAMLVLLPVPRMHHPRKRAAAQQRYVNPLGRYVVTNAAPGSRTSVTRPRHVPHDGSQTTKKAQPARGTVDLQPAHVTRRDETRGHAGGGAFDPLSDHQDVHDHTADLPRQQPQVTTAHVTLAL